MGNPFEEIAGAKAAKTGTFFPTCEAKYLATNLKLETFVGSQGFNVFVTEWRIDEVLEGGSEAAEEGKVYTYLETFKLKGAAARAKNCIMAMANCEPDEVTPEMVQNMSSEEQPYRGTQLSIDTEINPGKHGKEYTKFTFRPA